MYNNKEVFLQLVGLGLGKFKTATIPDTLDWNKIKELSSQQGLSAVVLDGIEELRNRYTSIVVPEKNLLTQWIGEVLQGYEYHFELYRRTLSELASFYNSYGYKMMVVKGYACSLDWPKPEHRPVGDIDIWLFGRYKEADAMISKEKGIEIDTRHHHHTVFKWRNFLVENHYDFLNMHQHQSNVNLEKILKQLAADDSYSVDVRGEKIYLPSPNLHAIFLLRHAMTHFSASKINLRQLLDWAFFVENHRNEVNWSWLKDVMEEYGMLPMFNIFNAICVENLGFEVSLFPLFQFDPSLKERVLNDILSPEFCGKESPGLIRRSWFKYRRWMANRWKHELCFNESLWSAFWTGIRGHLTTPKPQ